MANLVKKLVISWLFVGIFASIAGFGGWLYQPQAIMLLVPAVFLLATMVKAVLSVRSFSLIEKVLLLLLVSIWAIHVIGVFIPETGFDAVWYHLPTVATFVAYHRFVNIPELYQSLNPLFSDAVFMVGFLGFGQLGTKMIAFAMAVSLLLVSYELCRMKLNREWSLISVILISTFQVITWQASSFYIDVAKAFWEVSCLWLLLESTKQRTLFLSGLLFGASIASKAFSWLLLLPVMTIVWLTQQPRRLKNLGVFLIGVLLIGIPYYVRTYLITGQPFLSIGLHVDKLQQIGGVSSPIAYVLQRTWLLPQSLLQLSLFSPDYISFAVVLFLPFAGWLLFTQRHDRWIQSVSLWSAAQWLVWWYVPPLSTRYALSGFIALMILELVAVYRWSDQHPSYRRPLLFVIALAISWNMAPRLLVTTRSLRYLLTSQTQTEYLQQFYDGSIDSHLQQWYHIQ